MSDRQVKGSVHRRRAATLIGVGAVALVVTAAGTIAAGALGDDPSDTRIISPTPIEPNVTEPEYTAAVQATRDCLEDHGVGTGTPVAEENGQLRFMFWYPPEFAEAADKHYTDCYEEHLASVEAGWLASQAAVPRGKPTTPIDDSEASRAAERQAVEDWARDRRAEGPSPEADERFAEFEELQRKLAETAARGRQ